MRTRVFRTPFGLFRLGATPKGLYALNFPGQSSLPSKGSSASRSDKFSKRVSRLLDQAIVKIQAYLHGKKVDFGRLRIDWAGYSSFSGKVLGRLRKVSWGKTASYGDLARAAGSPAAGRAVGQVLRSNRLPIILPCHRIIRKSGRLGGFSKGPQWKKRLLKLESACVDKFLDA